MRLFVAIELTPEIRSSLASLLKEFHAVAPGVKWVRAENLHVTLKFLGETEEQKLPGVRAALAAIRADGAVTMEFGGLGFFPNEKRPRVFWAGMNGSPNLKSLAAGIDQSLYALGFPLEERPFSPHLTLARFNPPGLPANLRAEVQRNVSRSFGSLATREFHLIESELKSTGAEYTTLQSFSFAAEA